MKSHLQHALLLTKRRRELRSMRSVTSSAEVLPETVTYHRPARIVWDLEPDEEGEVDPCCRVFYFSQPLVTGDDPDDLNQSRWGEELNALTGILAVLLTTAYSIEVVLTKALDWDEDGIFNEVVAILAETVYCLPVTSVAVRRYEEHESAKNRSPAKKRRMSSGGESGKDSSGVG